MPQYRYLSFQREGHILLEQAGEVHRDALGVDQADAVHHSPMKRQCPLTLKPASAERQPQVL